MDVVDLICLLMMIGNFDPAKDPAKYNLVDPIERNTVGVPTGGWTAIRFRADNPGMYMILQGEIITCYKIIMIPTNLHMTCSVFFWIN